MKSLITLLFLITTCLICLCQDTPVYDQDKKTYQYKGSKHLIGHVELADLKQEPYKEWFHNNYDDFDVPQLPKNIRRKSRQFKIKIILGTWCGDSKREVPRLIKLFDSWGIHQDQYEIIAVSNIYPYYKQDLNGAVNELNIHRVPTTIFYNNDVEIGRIVEHPVTDLPTDVTQILLGYPSKPSYPAIYQFQQLLEHNSIADLTEKEDRIFATWSGIFAAVVN